MIVPPADWHEEAVSQFKAVCTPRIEVLAAAVFGSIGAVSDRRDVLSDVDVLLVVAAEAFDTYALDRDWLRDFGQIVGMERLATDGFTTLRVCLADFRRFDIVVTTDQSVLSRRLWSAGFLGQSVRILFSRSEAVAGALMEATPAPSRPTPTPQAYTDLAERFWFRAALAGYKVARKDRYVALHQALDLARDCCVLAMMLRDRTHADRQEDDLDLDDELLRSLAHPGSVNTAIGILGLIAASAEAFDHLSERWAGSVQRRSPALREWLAVCRRRLEVS